MNMVEGDVNLFIFFMKEGIPSDEDSILIIEIHVHRCLSSDEKKFYKIFDLNHLTSFQLQCLVFGL